MHEAGDTALRARAVEVRRVARDLLVRRVAGAAGERQDVAPDAEHPDVSERSAEFLGELHHVRRGGERMRLAGEIGPAAHQPGAVHVNQDVRQVEIFGDRLQEQRRVRETEAALMQIVRVRVA